MTLKSHTEQVLKSFDERFPVEKFNENPVVEREVDGRKEYLIHGDFHGGTMSWMEDGETKRVRIDESRVSESPDCSAVEEVVDEREKMVTVREWRLNESIKNFITTALKELSDLQAEETRVEKQKLCSSCQISLKVCTFCLDDSGFNSAVEKQEKLSNAFRGL